MTLAKLRQRFPTATEADLQRVVALGATAPGVTDEQALAIARPILGDPAPASTGVFDSIRETVEGAGGRAVAGVRAGVEGANATFSGFLGQASGIAQWVAIAMVALAVVAVVVGLIYITSPLISALRGL